MKKRVSLILMALIFLLGSLNFSTQSTSAASSTGNFEVTYDVKSSWDSEAIVNVTIKNKGAAVKGWTLDFKFSGNQKISNTWNCSYTQSGQAVKIKDAGYNAAIATGSSVSFGLNITFSGENKVPTEFVVNSQNAGSESTFHCFLLLGQSNMAGYPKAQASDKVKDERILVLGYEDNPSIGRKKDKWDVACPPLHEAWNEAVGPGDWFAKTLINKVPNGDTIGLVPCAISGEKIETFMKGGSKYNWILERAKLAQTKGGVIDGIIFHQGESNCGEPNWPNKVNKLVTDLRNDLKVGDVPFIAGELLRTGECSFHNRFVNQIPSVVKNSYVVSSEGLVVDPSDTWNSHFGHDSQVILGKRYAEKMQKALGW